MKIILFVCLLVFTISQFSLSNKLWFIGGSFNQVINQNRTQFLNANNIAQFDGENWSNLGLGTNGDVRSIEFDNCYNIFVGGVFTQSGGYLTTGPISKFNLQQRIWSTVTNASVNWSPGSYVNDILLSCSSICNCDVFLGGNFTLTIADSNVFAVNIVKFNTASNQWDDLGSINQTNMINGEVFNLQMDSDFLYIGGSFSGAFKKMMISTNQWVEFSKYTIVGLVRSMYFKIENYQEMNKIYLSGDLTITLYGDFICQFICQFNIKTEDFVLIGTLNTQPILPSLDIDYGGDYLYYSGSILNTTYAINRIYKPSTLNAWESINIPINYPLPAQINSIYACKYLDCFGSYGIGGSNGILHYYSYQDNNWYPFGNGTNGEVFKIQLYNHSFQFGLSLISIMFIVLIFL